MVDHPDWDETIGANFEEAYGTVAGGGRAAAPDSPPCHPPAAGLKRARATVHRG
jgi:hypothetical protein